ncbi:acyltransferase family protein [Bradyrhizobium sp.]|uniref:acyltransferase family protein n=1 Tax=Bradyrhizobium sp. TaxID=376 RepID=UPI0025C4CD6D|nr:acyltransferase family protein [Bradyrhizobium sp.]
MRSDYRTDIDGLRAIAVISVIAFHNFPHAFPGGFIGVDIFFVISGFLITNIICQNLQAGRFSFIDFYARRIRRIFPALIVVLTACMIAGWFVLLQDEFRLLGRNVGAAAGFVANFAFVLDAGYFGPVAELTPLLHLWSLSIEEQYYLIWPLLVALSWRYGVVLAVTGIVFAVSFIANIALVRTNLVYAFYLPVGRFWELMLGCGLSFATLSKLEFTNLIQSRLIKLTSFHRRHADAMHETAAWLGMALLLAALLLINRNRLFPGWWALLPTVGAALLIWAGQATLIGRLILGRRAMVYVGLISYPLYLWHWPILVFERVVRIKEPTDLMRLGGIAAAFILADLTYRLIEKPIRFGAPAARKSIAVSLALVTTGCLGLLIYVQDGFPNRIPEDVRELSQDLGDGSAASFRPGQCLLSAEQTDLLSKECDEGNSAVARKVVLWGDSLAARLYPGMRGLESKLGNFTVAALAASGCPPIFSFASEARKNCRPFNDSVARKIEGLNPETVIMAARWSLYDGRENWGQVSEAMIRETVIQLAAMGVKRIVVIGQFPVWQAAVPRIRIWYYRASIAGGKLPAKDRAFPESFKSELDWNLAVQRAINGTSAIFISALSTFCNDDGCLLAVPGRKTSVAFDEVHLTAAASEFFVESNADRLVGH